LTHVVRVPLPITGDQDGDGLPDKNEVQGDADGDGVPNFLDSWTATMMGSGRVASHAAMPMVTASTMWLIGIATTTAFQTARIRFRIECATTIADHAPSRRRRLDLVDIGRLLLALSWFLRRWSLALLGSRCWCSPGCCCVLLPEYLVLAAAWVWFVGAVVAYID